ncbi:unnamed protein product [Cylindrotheca closterium]|uniref:Uncharacterized protein n=1 Tax=Cylindrotheca closterium TaxID=2856 RepID=A0AAD2CEU6_9STRA|nr:unnamed protein product [Cylindrotheca closterium]
MDELFEAKRRKRKVESAHLDGPTPAWAQQMQTQMQTQMQQMQTQMQQMQTQMQQMQTQMQTQMQQMQTRITIESQKSRNFSRRSTADAIAQVSRELDGNTPRDYNQSMWFPADQNQLSQATGQELQELLLFYALPLDARVADRRKRLGNHLGVVL